MQRTTDKERPVHTGQLIANRFWIERRLARGGQAAVYLANQLPLNRPVALKILMPPNVLAQEELEAFRDRFLLEAKALAALNHPNIVVIYDYGNVDADLCYIAMEYIDGRRFSELLRVPNIDPHRLLRVVYQVCAALRYAHRQGVVHRDVKNSNILVSTDDNGEDKVKVVDFGIAQFYQARSRPEHEGLVMGSPHFMAPEQARGLPSDHRVDVYAVGVLLYTSLVGRYPFDGPNTTSIITAHLTQEVPRFDRSDSSPQLNPELEVIVRRCLAKDPADRFADIDQLMAELESFTQGRKAIFRNESATTTDIDLTDIEVRVEHRKAASGPRPGRFILAAALLVAAIIVLFLALMGPWNRSGENPAESPSVAGPAETPPVQPEPAAGAQNEPSPTEPQTLEAASEPAPEPVAASVTSPGPKSSAGNAPNKNRSAKSTDKPKDPAPAETRPADDFGKKSDIRDPWEK